MSNAQVDIMVQIKNRGMEVFNEILKKLKQIKTEMIAINKEALGFSPDKLLRVTASSSGVTAKSIKEIAKQIGILVDKNNELTRSAGQVAEKTWGRAFGLFSAAAGGMLAWPEIEAFWYKVFAVKKFSFIMDSLKKELSVLFVSSKNSAVNAGSTVFNFYKQSVTELFLGLQKMGSSAPLSGLFQFMFGAGKFSTFASISGFFFKNTVQLFQRLVGMGPNVLSPLQAAARLVATIDSTLHKVFFTWGAVGKTGAVALLAWLGPFNAITGVLGTINVAFSTLLLMMERPRLRFMAFFGSAKAKLQLLFVGIRDIILHLLPVIEVIEKKLKKAISSVITDGASGKHFWQASFWSWTNLKLMGNSLFGMQGAILEKFADKIKSRSGDIFAKIRAELEIIKAKVLEIINAILSNLGSIKLSSNLSNALATIPKKVQTQTQKELVATAGAKANPNQWNALAKETEAIKEQVKLKDDLAQKAEKVTKAEAVTVQKELESVDALKKKQQRIAELTVGLAEGIYRKSLTQPRAISRIGKIEDLLPAAGLPENLLASLKKQLTLIKENFSQLDTAGLKSSLKNFRKFLDEIGTLTQTAFTGTTLRSRLRDIFKVLPNDELSQLKAMQVLNLKALQDATVAQVEKQYSVMRKAGRKIVEFIAMGMNSGMALLDKTTDYLTERIAKFFPRSPAQLGALIALPFMGFKIIYYLTEGMMAAKDLLSETMDKLISYIETGINEATEKMKQLKIQASAMFTSFNDASKLDFVFSSLGASVSDLTFVMQKLNGAMAQGSEDARVFARLGFDIEAARLSGNYFVAMIKQASELLKKYKDDAQKTIEVTNAIGLTAGSALVPALQVGGDEIERLLNLAGRGLLFIDKAALKFATEKTKIDAILTGLKNSFFAQLVTPIGEFFEKMRPDLENFIAKSGMKIIAIGGLVGQYTVKFMAVISAFFRQAIDNPKSAMELLKDILLNTLDYVTQELTAFIDNFTGKIFTMFFAINSALYNVISAMLEKMVSNLLDSLVKKIKGFWENLKSDIKSVWGNFFDGIKMEMKDVFGEIPGLSVAKNISFNPFPKEPSERTPDKMKLGNGMIWNTQAAQDEINRLREMSDSETKKEAQKQVDEQNNYSQKALDIFKDSIKATSEEAKKQAAELKTSLMGILSSKETGAYLDDAKKRLEDYKFRMQQTMGTVASPELQQAAKDLVDALDPAKILGNYDELLKKLGQIPDAAKKVQDTAKKPGAKRQNILAQLLGFGDNPEGEEQYGFMGETMGKVETMFGQLYELSGRKRKEFFYAQKAFSIANAIISIAEGITKCLGMGIFGLALMPIIGAAGAVQIATIAAQQPPAYAKGGILAGGSGTKDDLLIRAMGGEFVMNKPSANYYGQDIMSAMNDRLIPREALAGLANFRVPMAAPAYASGGAVGPVSSGSFSGAGYGQAQPQQLNIVNVTSDAELDRYMASHRGQSIVMNVLQRNGAQAAKILRQYM